MWLSRVCLPCLRLLLFAGAAARIVDKISLMTICRLRVGAWFEDGKCWTFHWSQHISPQRLFLFRLFCMYLIYCLNPGNAGDVRDVGSIPVSGRTPGGGPGNTLQNFYLDIPWTEEPGGLQSIELQRDRGSWSDLMFTYTHTHMWSRLSDYVGDPQVSGQLLPSRPYCRTFAESWFYGSCSHCVFSIPLSSWQFLVGKSALKIFTFTYFGNKLMKGNIPDSDYKLEHGTITFLPGGNVY